MQYCITFRFCLYGITMKRMDTAIPGVQIITPDVYHDARGSFYEIFRKHMFPDFTQDNIRLSQNNGYCVDYITSRSTRKASS